MSGYGGGKFHVVFSFVIAGFVIFCFIYLVKSIISIFLSINAQLAAGIIAASATVVVSVVTIVLSKRQEQKILIANQLREKKIPIYENIIEFIFSITFAQKLGKEQPSEEEVIAFFAKTTKDLVVWGSHDVVVAFRVFKEGLSLSASIGDTSSMLSVVEDFLIELRKDLGHPVKKFKRGDILKIYINDFDDFFVESRMVG